MSDTYTSSYFKEVLETRMAKKIEVILAKYIRSTGVKFDSVVFRGMSGALMAPAIARRLNKELIMIRKDKDGSHSGMPIEGFTKTKRFIIVDDFICTGSTINAILDKLADNTNFCNAKCAGIFCYRGSRTESFKTKTDEEIPVFCLWAEENSNGDLHVTYYPERTTPAKKDDDRKLFADPKPLTQGTLDMA